MSFSNDIKFGNSIKTPIPDASDAAQFRNATIDERDRKAFERALEKREDGRGAPKNALRNGRPNTACANPGKAAGSPLSSHLAPTQNGSLSAARGETMNRSDFPFSATGESRSASATSSGGVSSNPMDDGYTRDKGQDFEHRTGDDLKGEDKEAPSKVGIESLFSQMNSPVNALAKFNRAEASSDSAQPINTQELESLVSRILVSSPEKGSTEVRLMLEDSVLKGTEISLVRDASGALQVKIFCSDSMTFQTLVASRNNLLETLNSRETAPVKVEMNEAERENQDAGDDDNPERRSQGLVMDEYGNII